MFELGNLERELAFISRTVSEKEHVAMLHVAAVPEDRQALPPSAQCSICNSRLPNGHLLDLHLEEVHDSFFAAQAARKMKVYRCLVESCHKRFSSPAERKQHLLDVHQFPATFDLEAMHVKKRRGQIRPPVELRRAAPKQRGQREPRQLGGNAHTALELASHGAPLAEAALEHVTAGFQKLTAVSEGRHIAPVCFGRFGKFAPMRNRSSRGRGRCSGDKRIELGEN